MNKIELILNYRTSRMLKGRRPSYIYLKKNYGKIYYEGQADFIMTISQDTLNFQRLSFFTKKLMPKKDFSIKISSLKSYYLMSINLVTNCLCLYTKDKNFIEIYYNVKLTDTYETEGNINDIIKMLEEKGVKLLEDFNN